MSLPRAAVCVISLLIAVGSSAQQPKFATVHVKIVDHTGHDLGRPTVEAFISSNGQNLASQFLNGSAVKIPYGTYMLRTYTTGFWSTERSVQVFQDDVWVLVGLELGTGYIKHKLTGRLENISSTGKEVWVRLAGVYSDTIIDTKASPAGTFEMGGIRQGLYTLVTSMGQEVIDVRTVKVVRNEDIIIKVLPEKQQGGNGGCP